MIYTRAFEGFLYPYFGAKVCTWTPCGAGRNARQASSMFGVGICGEPWKDTSLKPAGIRVSRSVSFNAYMIHAWCTFLATWQPPYLHSNHFPKKTWLHPSDQDKHHGSCEFYTEESFGVFSMSPEHVGSSLIETGLLKFGFQVPLHGVSMTTNIVVSYSQNSFHGYSI